MVDHVVAVLALALALAASSASRTAAETACGTPAECFAELGRRQRDVQSVEARFHQTKRIALLREPLESSGRFSFARDRGVRWEVEKPEPMVIEIAGEQLRAGPPGELRRVEAGSSADVLAQMTGLFTGAAKREDFTISSGRSPGGIRLVPRDPSLARIVSAIELEIESASGAPRSVEIEEASGDRTRIELTEVRIEPSAAAGTPR